VKGGLGTRNYLKDFLALVVANRFYFLGGVMSNQLAERYRYLASESRRLATNDPYAESRNFHLRMAELYSMLVEATERKTTRGHERLGQVRPNRQHLAETAYE
jgi:hypothetical protein